jgi:hypothetical protein
VRVGFPDGATSLSEIGRSPSGDRDQESGIRDQGSGIRDQGSGIRDQGSGIRDQESGIRDQGSEMGPREKAHFHGYDLLLERVNK